VAFPARQGHWLASAKAASEAKKALEVRQTFGQCAEALFKSKKPGWRAGKHASDWRRSVTDYCGAILDLPVEQVTTDHVLAVLSPLWGRIPETASRLRGRIEAVLDSAKAKGLRSGENPAAWRGHLALILPKRPKISKVHHPALAYSDVPAFIAKLRENESLHAPALEFIILTAARSAEALGARWAEIDLATKVWTIPAGRMKAGLAHRVPLSGRAIEIVEKQAATRNNDFLFPGVHVGRPLGPSSLRKLHPPGGTIHGFRSSFRDWAGEETQFPREVAEQALAHATGDATERAYRRGDALEKRRALMEAWANYCEPGAAGKVVPFRAAE
jgi:integrase